MIPALTTKLAPLLVYGHMKYITLRDRMRVSKRAGTSNVWAQYNRIVAHSVTGLYVRHARLQADPPGFPRRFGPRRQRTDVHRQPSLDSDTGPKPHLRTAAKNHLMRKHYRSHRRYMLHRQLPLPRNSILVDRESLLITLPDKRRP
jgi:hypothetical protein